MNWHDEFSTSGNNILQQLNRMHIVNGRKKRTRERVDAYTYKLTKAQNCVDGNFDLDIIHASTFSTFKYLFSFLVDLNIYGSFGVKYDMLTLLFFF